MQMCVAGVCGVCVRYSVCGVVSRECVLCVCVCVWWRGILEGVVSAWSVLCMVCARAYIYIHIIFFSVETGVSVCFPGWS